MIRNYKDGKFMIRTVIISFFVVSIIAYSIFQSTKIINGPSIKITSPINYNLSQSAVDIAGVAKNTAIITLDDRVIPIDENGNFREKILLFSGYNIIKLEAKDKFGSTVRKDIQLVYK